MSHWNFKGFQGTLADLDKLINKNWADIMDGITRSVGHFVSGVKIRVASVVVLFSADGMRFYLYKRTEAASDQDPLRGTAEKWETPKGVVDPTGPGKWNIDEEKIVGSVVGVQFAHEYRATGNYPEFVFMPVFVFRVTEATEAYLTANTTNVHPKLKGVKRYEWVLVDTITADNAMTKPFAAKHAAEAARAAILTT